MLAYVTLITAGRRGMMCRMFSAQPVEWESPRTEPRPLLSYQPGWARDGDNKIH